MTDSVKLPDVPDKETWLAMTPDERMDVVRSFRVVLGGSRLQDVSTDPDAYYMRPATPTPPTVISYRQKTACLHGTH
jgi:hypothetical protein